MNYEFLNAAREILSSPIVCVGIGAAAVVGLWKGAKALAKSAEEERRREAEFQADLAELRRVVTPIEFPPRRKSTHQP